MNGVDSGNRPAWDLALNLLNVRLCEAHLSVAEHKYPDLLLSVRRSVARAMSGWLLFEGYRANVNWSEDEGCFVGQLRGVEDIVVGFQGKSPTELQDEFIKAVQAHRGPATVQQDVENQPLLFLSVAPDDVVAERIIPQPRKLSRVRGRRRDRLQRLMDISDRQT